jgi:sensor histidine kinase regulating citrate/malate metabolism
MIMIKTLAGRALIPVGLAVTGFVVVCFLLLYSGIKNVLEHDAVGHAANLADTVLKSTRYSMLKSDRETLGTIVHNIGEQKGVEFIRIFNKKGVVNLSSRPDEIGLLLDKKAEGCIGCHLAETPTTKLGKMEQARTFRNKAGLELMAITAPIYNDPQCSNAACHFHPSSQKILGTLDIGLSQEMMTATLASIRNQMIMFTLMVLVLTVGGVTAILRRSVFLPMQKVEVQAGQAEEDDGVPSIPARLPRELDTIAHSLYNLHKKLRRTQEELVSDRKR